MKKILFITFFYLISLVVIAQEVLVIGNRSIDLNEFKSLFYKNYNNQSIDQKYLDEYMDLFINFKLKVINAEDMQMDTIKAFIDELEGYKQQLARPYLTNKEFDNKIILEAYERMKYDIKASHILVSLDENASEKERIISYNKAISIRNNILSNNITFSDAAKKYSDDPSASDNRGNLGYFTVFMMVYDFEDVAYNTNIGDISMPVRTKYGYHLIKVNDKRNALGTVEVAHIMFKTGSGADEKRVNITKDKIYQAYEKIQNGQDFAEVAELYSEDRQTAIKGGLLPPFGVGKFVPEFEEVVSSLKEINQVSKPFQTKFGWHVVKLISKQEVPSFNDIEVEIKRKIERDSRSELSKEALYKKLRKENKVKNNVSSFRSLRRIAFSEVNKGEWDGSFTDVERDLFYINSIPVNVESFIKYLLANQSKGSDFDDLYINFVNKELLAFEEESLEEKYPEYKSLLNEYREGILLFNLMDKKVWKKAVEDTIGLKEYFEVNSNKYMWNDRVKATLYTCTNISTLRKIKSQLFLRRIGLINHDQVLKEINKLSSLDLQYQSGIFSKNDNKYIDSVEWSIGVKKEINLDNELSGSFILVDIHEVLKPSKKSLKDVRGKVISDYQTYLEKEWLSILKSKYNVFINKDVLYSIIK